MDVNPSGLKAKTKKEIVRDLIDHVTKSEEEVSRKQTRGGKTTDLKLYLCDSKGFEIGTVESITEEMAVDGERRQAARDFGNNHTFEEEILSDEVSFLTISTPDYERTDDFILLRNNGYLWVLTTEPKDWIEDTIFKLIKYCRTLEKLYLSSSNIEEMILDLDKAHVSGFTAKYSATYQERDATLRFHGAEPDDLDKAKDAFKASPTRLEFDQANSPSVAIQGAQTNDGEVKIESVRQGSGEKAVETLLGLSEEYQKHDNQNFEVTNPPEREAHGKGETIRGITAIELHSPDRESSDPDDLIKDLKENVLSSYQYDHGFWGEDTLFVHDEHHSEVFELAIEAPNLILYAKETTTSLSLRSFCKQVIDEVDSTYSIRKCSSSVTGGSE